MASRPRSANRRKRRDKIRAANRRQARAGALGAIEREPERDDPLQTVEDEPGRPGLPVAALLVGSASLLILLGIGLYFLLGREAAPPEEWSITGFDARVTVHASGSVDMVETITYDFGDEPSHGLTRELPETGWIDGYGWRDFGLTGIRGEGPDGLPVEISPHRRESRGESMTVVRLGDFEADPALTGVHVFEIAYTYERLTTLGSDGAPNYYADIIGAGWRVPVESVDVAFHLPDLAHPDGSTEEGQAGQGGGTREPHTEIDAACYVGYTGERGGCADLVWAEPDLAEPLLTAGHERLFPGEAMSVRLSLPPSVYSAERTGEGEGAARPDPPDPAIPFVVVGLLILVCAGGLMSSMVHLVDHYFPPKPGSVIGSGRVGGGGAGGGGGGAGGGGGGGAGGGGGGGGGG